MNDLASLKRRVEGDLTFQLGGEEVFSSRAPQSDVESPDVEEFRAVEDELNRQAAITELEDLQDMAVEGAEDDQARSTRAEDLSVPQEDEGIIRADDAGVVHNEEVVRESPDQDIPAVHESPASSESHVDGERQSVDREEI